MLLVSSRGAIAVIVLVATTDGGLALSDTPDAVDLRDDSSQDSDQVISQGVGEHRLHDGERSDGVATPLDTANGVGAAVDGYDDVGGASQQSDLVDLKVDISH